MEKLILKKIIEALKINKYDDATKALRRVIETKIKKREAQLKTKLEG